MHIAQVLVATGWGVLAVLSTFRVIPPFSGQLTTTLICVLLMMMVIQQDTKE